MLGKMIVWFFCMQLYLPLVEVSAIELASSEVSSVEDRISKEEEKNPNYESTNQIPPEQAETIITNEPVEDIRISTEEDLLEIYTPDSSENVDELGTNDSEGEVTLEEEIDKDQKNDIESFSEEIYVPDVVLKEVINRELGKESDMPIYKEDFENRSVLSIIHEGVPGKKIRDLTGLSEIGKNTWMLLDVRIPNNDVEDLTPLIGIDFIYLSLSGNNIKDVSPLSSANTTFVELQLDGNRIKDFSSLKNKTITRFSAKNQQINIFEELEQSNELVMPSGRATDGSSLWGPFKVPALLDRQGNKLTLKNASSNISTHMYHLSHDIEQDTVTGGINTAVNVSGIFAIEAVSSNQEVSFYHESMKADAPFLQAVNIYGYLIELDRESQESKLVDFGLVQTIYGRIGTSQTNILQSINESRPLQREITLNFRVNPSNLTVYYQDKAIDDGLGLVVFQHNDILGNKIKEDDVYLRAAGSTINDLAFPDFDSYRLLTEVPPTILVPPADEPLYWEVVYGQVVELLDPVLEREVRQKLAINDEEILDDDMQNLISLSYTGSDLTGKIADLTGLEYAINLSALSLENNAVSDVTPIGALDKLTQLNLNENGALSSIKGLPSMLQEIQLNKTQVNDYGFLDHLKELRRLALSDTNMTNQELAQLASLSTIQSNQLEYLDLRRNHLSDISLFNHPIDYEEIGSPDDFHKNTGVNLANQLISLNHRITAGRDISILNPVVGRDGKRLRPLEDGTFIFEGDNLIWALQLDETGNLAESVKQINYDLYDGSNYSAILTVNLQYEPIKIDIPIQLEIEREGVSNIVGRQRYQIINRSAFPIETKLIEVIPDDMNELTLVEEITGIEGELMLFLVSGDGDKTNFLEKDQRIASLKEQESLVFELEGTFMGKKQADSYDLNYQIQFHFAEIERQDNNE